MHKKFMMVLLALFFSNYCWSVQIMPQDNKVIAQAYYTAMAEKNIDGVAQFLDEDVVFTAPLTTVVGKQEFLERVQEFFVYSEALTIRAAFGSQDQAMVVFTSDYPAPIGSVEFAALLDIKDGLITKIELFYDARPFEKK